ncbi:hypothetical protein [Leifsonia sp. AG29]|uniref:hypothetical protein n=1 Tax=Leifsonia sp. AG29 TaxID=2598860 RepID=UPI00131DB068|nr:hypothetical protein [Leifsonia sp. AG29]
MSRPRNGVAAGALVACLTAGVSGIGAAPISTVAPSDLCIPLFSACGSPSPSPSPTSAPKPSSGVPGLPTLPAPAAPGAPGAPLPTPTPAAPAPLPGGPDNATVFTEPPAQLGSQSLSFSGLKGISVVTVPLADGSRVPVLKISADSITIDGFSLTVRKASGPSLSTTADKMTLTGDVNVYLDSVTATGEDGKSITLGAATPPPQDGVPVHLLRATLGLVGATADDISYTNTKQHLSE